MLKLKNSATLVVAVLCGYLALMTPDWKSDLVAASGVAYLNDHNGDTRADILLRNTGTGDFFMATLNGMTVLSQGTVGAFSDIENVVVSSGDFNGDKNADILTRGTVNGLLPGTFRVELTNGSTVTDAAWMFDMSTDNADQVMSTKDFNYDGKADVLLRNSVTGAWTMNYMNGTGTPTVGALNGASTDLCYTMKGDGDYDGNLVPDIALRRDACGGASYPWIIHTLKGDFNVYQTGPATGLSANTGYAVLSADKDFNGDGRDDVLLRATSGATQQWITADMNGVNAPSQGVLNLAVQSMWQISTVADFNGDGKTDVMIRSVDTGQWYAYLLDDRTATLAAGVVTMSEMNPIWVLQSVDDFSGDGKTDILVRNSADGTWRNHVMNGLTITSPVGQSLTIPTDLANVLQND